MANNRHRGAVSIFAVIFAALLLTVLTVGFISLMISAHQRAIDNDLSQSAYDASLAGVEDAKRVVRACLSGASTQACDALAAADDCRVIQRANIVAGAASDETIIRSNSGEAGTYQEGFSQAYTCVNIAMNTPDYLDEVHQGQASLVPLRATSEFNRVVIEWFTQEDARAGVQAARPTSGPDFSTLPPVSGWHTAAPPLIRAQLILPGDEFDLNSLDSSEASRTVFLRPGEVSNSPPSANELNVSSGAIARASSAQDASIDNDLQAVRCSSVFANDGYSCRATLMLFDPVGSGSITPSQSNNAFLRINSIYKSANIRVSLLSASGSTVNFNGVQPQVDSTGRANTLFRRVDARLRIGDDFPYPNYAVDVASSLCKDFSVYPGGTSGSSC